MAKLTKKLIAGLRPDPTRPDAFTWDTVLRGFGVRVKQSGVASYLIQYRTPEGATRRLAIGRIGTLTLDEARKLARNRLVAVAGGADPSADRHRARGALNVADLCDQYLAAARGGLVVTRFRRQKRTSTITFDQGRIERHIKPLLGLETANKLTRTDVQRMADAISQGKTDGVFKGRPRGKAVVTGGAGTAARVVGLLGGIWTWAERRGLVTGTNPARGIETSCGVARDRVLSPIELRRLGAVLDHHQRLQPSAVAAVRLIAMTGLRKQEACALRWQEIDPKGSCLRLELTKTGRSVRPIGRLALELLQALPRRPDDCDWVFASQDGKKSADLKKRIAGLFNAAHLKDARSHDLRRTFASVAADEGYSDGTIGELLGHAQRSVTARHYIRRPDAALVAAADRVATRIAAALDGKPAAEIVSLPSYAAASA